MKFLVSNRLVLVFVTNSMSPMICECLPVARWLSSKHFLVFLLDMVLERILLGIAIWFVGLGFVVNSFSCVVAYQAAVAVSLSTAIGLAGFCWSCGGWGFGRCRHGGDKL